MLIVYPQAIKSKYNKKEMILMIGIYAIRNTKNGKMYN